MQKSQKIKSKEEEQTIQCTKEEEQTTQCTKEEEQTIQAKNKSSFIQTISLYHMVNW